MASTFRVKKDNEKEKTNILFQSSSSCSGGGTHNEQEGKAHSSKMQAAEFRWGKT